MATASPRAVIAAYKRTPFTPAYKGALRDVRPDDLAAIVMKALAAPLDASMIEDVKLGCAFPEGEQGLNIARLATFVAELPITIAGVTINRFCGSSMQAIHDAAGAIALGAGEAFLCAGVESMTRVPMTGFNPLPNPALYERYPEAYESMGITAENLANQYKISRKDQETFAVESHQKAVAAAQAGHFRDEILVVGDVAQDGCIRPETSAEGLAELKPAFDAKGSVTAGTSSPLTDGAAGVLLVNEATADRLGLPKLAAIRSVAVSGCAPDIMGIGPVSATKKALARARLSLQDMDVIELNEAFAAQSLAVIKELGVPTDRLNLDGGAIALGHPLGASGARITGKAASLLKRTGGKYALATMCIGGGQGIATVLEAI
ncbi:MAG: thiolase family protein [Hyphomicrobiales bacterium]|nr:thiolase family protein [Hyphomicrobiales bacterium]